MESKIRIGPRLGRILSWAVALALWAGLLAQSALAAVPAGATVWGFSEGLALCELEGKWGYVDGARNVAIPIQYDSAVSFSLGIAAVNLGGKLGVIRQDGAYLIRPEYDTLMPIDCGLYIAQKGGRWGVVSIVPCPDGQGGSTNVLYDLVYDSVQVTRQGGLEVLTLSQGAAQTMLPVFQLASVLEGRGVESAQFPLTRNRLPSFSDVSPRDWYALWVDIAYNVGLISGVGGGRFAPRQDLTVAEAIQLAATLESRYRADSFHHQPNRGALWYSRAVDYCLASGILRSGQFEDSDYFRPITREELAVLFANTTLARDMPLLSSLEEVSASIPDVDAASSQANAIYSLYAKGIFSGVDGRRTFSGGGTVSRAEAAAIVSRMARAEQRIGP